MKSLIFILAVFAAKPLLPAQAAMLPEDDRIFVTESSLDLKKHGVSAQKAEKGKRNRDSSIIFVVRMPASWNPEESLKAKKENRSAVRGVIAYCPGHNTEEELVSEMKKQAGYHHLVKLADKYNMALVSWSNFGHYDNSKNFDEISREEQRKMSQNMDARAAEWERGFKRILKNWNIPQGDAMVYGVSGGAQTAHRIVMRKPQYFSGIYIHVNSSYEAPSKAASKVLWFISTGELEYGYASAERFYIAALDSGYCAIFKAAENLGHATNDQTKAMCSAFFEYLIHFIPDATDPKWTPPPVDKFEMMRYPAYIGDYLNHVAYPPEKAQKLIPKKHMVALPTKQIAQSWGTIIDL